MQGFGNIHADGSWSEAMRGGDFARAWRISDAVLAGRDPAARDDPALPYHLRWVWDGRPLAGRAVLVRCYHGLGDTLQFARYLAPLRRLAARVTLEVQPELLPLLRCAADRVVPFAPARPLPPAEADVEIMELAHALRLRPQDGAAWLDWPEAVVTNAIGLCWEAGGWDRARSVELGCILSALGAAESPRPAPRAWSPPSSERGGWPEGPGRVGPLVSLQRGPASRQATTAAFLNPCDDDPGIARTAALISGARLVVTVDTMVAHLAGTLGAPTLLLLKHEADWRWGRGERTPWYPSLRLLRQAAPADWSEPLAALSTLLAG